MAAQFQGGIASNNQCRVIMLLDLDCFYCEDPIEVSRNALSVVRLLPPDQLMDDGQPQ